MEFPASMSKTTGGPLVRSKALFIYNAAGNGWAGVLLATAKGRRPDSSILHWANSASGSLGSLKKSCVNFIDPAMILVFSESSKFLYALLLNGFL